MIQPVLNKILIKSHASDEKSIGGLIVPECFRRVSDRFTVVAVGKGSADRKMQFKPGDMGIRIPGEALKAEALELLIDGELHYLLDQKWVLARLN